MNEPLVSILISVYNAGEYLHSAVESILNQTYSNLEVFIIDDGSTDGCMDTISDLRDSRIRVLTQPNDGKSVALNQALDELSGEFYAIQDADDISYPQRIERQVKCMLENTNLAAVFTGHDIILDGWHVAPRFAGKSIEQCHRDIEYMRMPAHDPTGMFRMSMVSDLRYEPTLRVGQGWDYILRVGERYPMVVLAECLYSYRCNYSSNTRSNAERRMRKAESVLARAYARRKEGVAGCIRKPVHRGASRGADYGIVPHFMESILDLRRTDRNWEALKTAFACLRLHPCDPYYYKPLAYFLAPLILVRYYRSIKAKTV